MGVVNGFYFRRAAGTGFVYVAFFWKGANVPPPPTTLFTHTYTNVCAHTRADDAPTHNDRHT